MRLQLSKNHFFWLNIVWFQAAWFSAILYTNQATFILFISLCLHFIFTPTRSSDLKNLMQITVIGMLADYLLTYLGILNFTDITFIPIWLILLWAHFSLTLNHSMRWLSDIPIYVRILFGAIFGTLSYYSGAKLEAVTLNENLILSLFSLAVIWGSMLPVYTVIASLNRMRDDENINKAIKRHS